jgi:putative ABC transport system permease protein
MFWKLIREPFRRPRSRRRALWAVFAVAMGTAVSAAMLSVSLDVGDRIGNELRALGANIVISPAADSLPVEIGGVDYRPVSEGAYIPASALPKLKEIFWRNNIVAFAPYLYVPSRVAAGTASVTTTLVGTWFDHAVVEDPGEEFRTGIQALNPTWKLDGSLPRESSGDLESTAEAVLGRSLASRLGIHAGEPITLTMDLRDQGSVSRTLRVAAILTTGGEEDEQMFAPLEAVQHWANLPDRVRKVQVAALIKPEDELSRKGPNRMTSAEYDRWYCSPYISSIVHQIGEAIPGTSSRAVRQVAETQGQVLGKLTFLMLLLTVVALVAAALSISSMASLTVLERRDEIGVMKALGAGNGLVAGFFLTEMGIQGLCGGLLGFAAGQLLAAALGQSVFGTSVGVHWPILPAMALVGVAVSLAGTIPPVWRAVKEDPARVLRSA